MEGDGDGKRRGAGAKASIYGHVMLCTFFRLAWFLRLLPVFALAEVTRSIFEHFAIARGRIQTVPRPNRRLIMKIVQRSEIRGFYKAPEIRTIELMPNEETSNRLSLS